MFEIALFVGDAMVCLQRIATRRLDAVLRAFQWVDEARMDCDGNIVNRAVVRDAANRRTIYTATRTAEGVVGRSL